MSPQDSTINEYPLLHVYPLLGPRQSLQIKGNTAGLRSLLDALICALGHEGSGLSEQMCSDAEPFEVHVDRIEPQEEWQELPLPYPEQSSEQLEQEQTEADDPVADLFKYYTGEVPETIYEAAKSWTEPES